MAGKAQSVAASLTRSTRLSSPSPPSLLSSTQQLRAPCTPLTGFYGSMAETRRFGGAALGSWTSRGATALPGTARHYLCRLCGCFFYSGGPHPLDSISLFLLV